MTKLKRFEDYVIYGVGITYYHAGTDLAIANLAFKEYSVLGKNQDSAIQKAKDRFEKDFPGKSIDKISISIKIGLEDCLF
jgi:hypothetical protein